MPLLPFDESGIAPSNLVENESHTITAINGVDHNYLVPDYAPFFAPSMVVVDKTTGLVLKKGVDYDLSHRFLEGVSAIAKELNGSIVMLDPNITGEFILVYQSLGGDFVTDDTKALEDGIDTLTNVLATTWEDVVGVPPAFPPTAHREPVTDINAVSEIIAQMERTTQAIAQGSRNIKLEDVTDLKEVFIDPLLTAMRGIASAIENKTVQTNNHFIKSEYPANNAALDIGSFTAGLWRDLPLKASVPGTLGGSYMVMWDVELEAPNEVGLEFEYRFVVNDAVMPLSHNKGTVMSLVGGWEVTLQARVKSGFSTRTLVNGPSRGASLIMVRLSN